MGGGGEGIPQWPGVGRRPPEREREEGGSLSGLVQGAVLQIGGGGALSGLL